MMYSDSRQKKSPLRRLGGLLILLAVAFLVLAWWRVGPDVELEAQPRLDGIGPATVVDVVAREGTRGLSDLKAELVQGDTVWPLVEKQYEARPFWAFWGPRIVEDRLELVLGKTVQKELLPGEAVLRLTASRGSTPIRRPAATVLETVLPVRLTPPELSLIAAPSQLRQGGSGAVVYRVGETTRRHGLKLGEREVVASTTGEGHALLFGAPFDLADGQQGIRLFAEDDLGNRAERRFVSNYVPRTLKTDDIGLSDGFFDKVVPEILSQTPEISAGATPLETYLTINNELRRRNAEQLVELSRDSSPDRLWQGAFSQLPSSRVMAGFAERRSYRYEGREVDEQVHLGFDLASRKRASVPAANAGVVVLARFFGIYGKTVVVDHGQGLMSLYSHLSDIEVAVGDSVAAGDRLGRTGATGLAGGDHLHYSMLIHGVQVDPLEWWDGRWIRNHIESLMSREAAP